MKTFKFILSVFLIITLFTFNQCKKCNTTDPAPDNPYGLPNATQTGANMFACRVNGNNWISKTDIYNLGAFVGSDTLSFGGSGGGNYFNRLYFFIRNASQGASYLLNDLQNRTGGVFITSTSNPCVNGTLTSNSISGILSISKYDVPNNIISGNFNCTIPIPQCDTLKITDGRFDIKFHY